MDHAQVLAVGNETRFAKFKKFYRDGEGNLRALWTSDFETKESDENVKEQRCGCDNVKDSKMFGRTNSGKSTSKTDSTIEPLQRRISSNIFLKLKGFAAKSKFHHHTIKKTYSTYSVPFCFRRIYPDLSFDCKTNKKIVPKPPKQEVVEEAKPRPKRSYSGPKRSGVRRKATVESECSVILRVLPDVGQIDVFDRKETTQRSGGVVGGGGRRKRFTTITQKLVQFNKATSLVNLDDLNSSGKRATGSPEQTQDVKKSVLNAFAATTTSISSKSNKTDEPRSGQNQKRNPKRNVVRTKTITEMKPEPEIEKVTDAKADREQKLTDLCMANPKWSHVIHYHNKIKKYGVKLDLDTLLHGMLPPSDYKEIHDKCFGPQEVVLHEDQEEE